VTIFNIGSPEELYKVVVIPQYTRFREANSNISSALGAIVTAYHLYEWANDQNKFDQSDFLQRFPNETTLSEYFEIARKLTNGVKHKNFKIKTNTQVGFSSAFGLGFARPLNIELEDGSSISVDDLLETIMDFWAKQSEANWPSSQKS
jgi:hypothetical protein